MKRTAIKRRTPLKRKTRIRTQPPTRQQAVRNSTLRPRSKRTAAIYRNERVPLVRRLLEERPWCEAQLEMCTGRSRDAHELLARSALGSITDEENILMVCGECHRWITDHPGKAKELGLSRSRYG